MPRYEQFGTFPALKSGNRRLRSPFAPGDGDLPLSDAIGDAIMLGNCRNSGECRLNAILRDRRPWQPNPA